MRVSEKQKGTVAAVLYSTIIGFSFLAVKTALGFAATPVLLAHRFTLALLAGLAVAALRKIDIRIKPRDFLAILPLAAFYPVAYFLFQGLGLQHTPSSMAGILQSTAPVFAVILGAVVLRERTTGLQLLGVGLTIAGVALLSLQNSGAAAGDKVLYGSLLLLFSAAAHGTYNVLARRLSRRYPVFVMTLWMLAVAFAVFNLYALFTVLTARQPALYTAPLAQPGYLVAVLYLGVLSSLVSAYLSNYALARIEAAKMSVFGSLATVISVAAGVIFLREPFHLLLLLGMGIIVLGVVLVNRKKAM